jgi:peroxiredoxin Q/BCP
MSTTLKPGDKAPTFSLKNQAGEKVSLKDFKGQKLVIFFYPKDMTPTCTVEACNLRDNYDALQKKGIQVIGVSPDDEKSHIKFIDKHELPYTLLADPEQEMLNKYGVWGEKSMYGRKYMGVLRTTFLVNEDGKIHEVISKVEAKNHAAQILKLWGLK